MVVMWNYNKKHIHLLGQIAYSQFKLKDQSTFFGFLWTFLHPLIMLTILFAFFNFRMGQEINHYGIYILIGLVQYMNFSVSTSASMRVLYSMRQLTSNTVFPKELLVFGSVVSNAIEFLISMLVCIVIAYFAGVNLLWSALLLPVVIVLQLMLILWVSLFLSCLYVFVRDIDHIYQVFLRVLLFITPIFYDFAFLGEGIAKRIALLNPLTHLVMFSRTLLIEGRVFPLGQVISFSLINLLLIYLGAKVFKKLEPTFAERV